MKKIKLILATFVAVLATFVGGKALADEYKITINGAVSGHTYEAYQIFTGDLSDSTLSNVKWGANVSGEGQTALGDATAVAEELAKATNNATEAKNFATKINGYLTGSPAGSGTTAITGLAAGYYLIKDKDDATSAYILEVVKNVEVAPKIGTPTVEKKVKDTNDTTGVTSDWQDSADHDINDSVPFQLTATLPANLDSYNQYYLEFADTLSAGLTYEADSLHIYAVNGSDEKEITGFFYAKESSGNLKIAISDLKGIDNIGYATINKDTKIVVRYSAKLNENAVIGSAGNPNTVKLVYSNNPNNSGDGTTKPDTPDTPDKPNEEEPPTPPTETGETPKDTVIVFTYKAVVNKVDQDKKPLVGAEFTLSKKMKDGSLKEIAVVKNTAGDQFSFNGLDDGDYVLKETKTPAGYNTISDITFTVEASHETEAAEPKLTSLKGVAPSGEIEFTETEEEAAESGTLTTQVKNNKGSILPSTGSVGTTMLYVVGTMLVLGAGVLLITKKRMDVK